MGSEGMIATSHPMATQAGLDMLKQGGNALDAAIAASAVQCVVEPFSTGIGGDSFLLYHEAREGVLYGLNGSGRSPSRAMPEVYLERGLSVVPERGMLSVTVPGAVDAWHTAAERFATKGLDALLAPAIEFAQNGYAISSIVGQVWAENEAMLASFNGMNNPLLKNGSAPVTGSIHKQPQLAATLRLIAETGRDAFYRGEIAEKLVKFSDSQGGLLSLDDFYEHHSEWVDPISSSYHGVEVFELPPNGQGVTALMMLNMLQQSQLIDLTPLSPEHIHLMSETFKLAIAERDAFVADPNFSAAPIDELLSPDHSSSMLKKIKPDSVLPYPLHTSVRRHRDTVYISVVDRDRNAASIINSLYYPFGSMMVAADTGIVLQNRGAGFVLEPGHPNSLEPSKRPLHTIIPAMAYRDGELLLCFGVMGGQYQAMGHTYLLSNWLNFDMDLQQAIDAPRFLPEQGVLSVEKTVPLATRNSLSAIGHRVVESTAPMGGAQAVFIDNKSGVLHGASDFRKDGCAMGY